MTYQPEAIAFYKNEEHWNQRLRKVSSEKKVNTPGQLGVNCIVYLFTPGSNVANSLCKADRFVSFQMVTQTYF